MSLLALTIGTVFFTCLHSITPDNAKSVLGNLKSTTVSWATIKATRLQLSLQPQEATIMPTPNSENETPSSSSSSSGSDTESKPKRERCLDCNKWHRRNQIECDVTLPQSTTNSALHGDNKLRTWLDQQCSLNVDPKRITVVRSFLQSAKAQITLASFLFDVKASLPTNASTHSLSTVVEQEINDRPDFFRDLKKFYLVEIQKYKGQSAFAIPSPLSSFRTAEFQLRLNQLNLK